MVFSSLTFLFLFMPIFFLGYNVVPKRLKNAFLLIGGVIFYAWGEPYYIFALLISTSIDYVLGLIMHKFDDRDRVRKIALISSVLLNLSLLGIFKYSGFIAGNINALVGHEILNINPPLPIGISFYTFQTLSYSIDLYRRRIKVQKNPISFAAYVTMFPQVVAGPIVRYEDVALELDERKVDLDMMFSGICRFIMGLGKKVLLANNIGILWETIKSTPHESLSAATAWIGIIAFAFQLYLDFSGYSDMAIGLGRMMGFSFPENFDYPYSSNSISEFWRRWHITLGSWFKSYVYFPLGGSRVGKLKMVINLSIVWLLTGLWHGASWNFVFWGAMMGFFVIMEKLVWGRFLEKLPWFVSNLYVMLIVILLWVPFEMATMSDSFSYLRIMFLGGDNRILIDQRAAYIITNYFTLFIGCIFASSELPKNIVKSLGERFPRLINIATVITMAAVFVGCTAYLVDAGYNPFLYTNF